MYVCDPRTATHPLPPNPQTHTPPSPPPTKKKQRTGTRVGLSACAFMDYASGLQLGEGRLFAATAQTDNGGSRRCVGWLWCLLSTWVCFCSSCAYDLRINQYGRMYIKLNPRIRIHQSTLPIPPQRTHHNTTHKNNQPIHTYIYAFTDPPHQITPPTTNTPNTTHKKTNRLWSPLSSHYVHRRDYASAGLGFRAGKSCICYILYVCVYVSLSLLLSVSVCVCNVCV